MHADGTGRLRRPTLVVAPLLLIALMGASFTLWLAMWGLAHPHQVGASFWVPLVVTSILTAGAFTLAKGCYVEIRADLILDVVGWVPIQKLDRPSIVQVRVRPGLWRLFELTMSDGTTRVLLGASPTQFPARLLEGSSAQDVADIERILGE